jgi:hypothetical protein
VAFRFPFRALRRDFDETAKKGTHEAWAALGGRIDRNLDELERELADPLTVGGTPTDNIFTTADAGTSSTAAHSDHQHGMVAGNPGDLTFGGSSSGSSDLASRSDHRHGNQAGTPVEIQAGVAPSDGTSGQLPRADHQHGTTSGTATAITAGTAATAGTGTGIARDNHVHSISTAAPSGGSEGSASSLARSDHGHAATPFSQGTVRSTTDQSITSNTETRVAFDSGTLDATGTTPPTFTGASNYRLTAGLPGRYLVEAEIKWEVISGGALPWEGWTSLHITKNDGGTPVLLSDDHRIFYALATNPFPSNAVSTTVYLSDGDTISCSAVYYVLDDASAAVSMGLLAENRNSARMSITYLGPS